MVYRREASTFTDAREYLFKHDILREVTYESVLKRLRRRYHGLVADWLISQVAGRVGEYSGLIAGHLLQAGRMEQAGAYYLQAGQAALASFANSEAERYFRQSLEQSPTEDQKATCLTGLGEALSRQGSRQEAVELLRQGIELYLKKGDSDAAANLYTGISSILWYYDYQKAWETCQEALVRLEGSPESPGMARLLAQSGRTAYFLARPADEVISLCQRAMEMAEVQGAQEAKAEVIITMALRTTEFDKSVHLLQEAIAFSEANRLWGPASRAHINLGVVLIQNFQNLETVYQQHKQALDIYIHIGDIEGLFFELDNLAEIIVEQGHFKSAEDKLTEILRSSTAPQARVDEYLDKIRSELSWWRGEWTRALEYNRFRLGEARETSMYQMIANRNLLIASIYLELNRFKGMANLSEAEAALRENIDIGWFAPESHLLMVVISSRLERFAEAHERLAEVIKELDQPIPKPIEMFRFQAEAELARAEGSWEDAVSKCQALIDILQAGGYWWQVAWRFIDIGDSLIGRDLPGDREEAMKVYRQSLEMFTEMGAPGYIQVLEERLGRM
jgi:tetratricopeptide (TPR) repeat protein